MAPKIVSKIYTKLYIKIHSPGGVHLVLTILWTILLTALTFLDGHMSNIIITDLCLQTMY